MRTGGVIVFPGHGAVVQVGGPRVGSAAIAGAGADRVAELFICGPTESDIFGFAGLTGGGRATPARQANDSGVADGRGSHLISSSRRAARVFGRGREVKMCAPVCRMSCSAMLASRDLIRYDKGLYGTATNARVVAVVASAPVLLRGALVSGRAVLHLVGTAHHGRNRVRPARSRRSGHRCVSIATSRMPA